MNYSNFESGRRRMVNDIKSGTGISDMRLLNAMLGVPRHEFVRPEDKEVAYVDCPLPIDEGQTISQPSLVARMTRELQIAGDESILEIGTGSGYQAAILSLLCKKVVTIERIKSLFENAKKTFKKLKYKNIITLYGDGTQGYDKFAPYDGIIITAGFSQIPAPLEDQLAEGGYLVMPQGGLDEQILIVAHKKDGNLVVHELGSVRFVPLIGKNAWEK